MSPCCPNQQICFFSRQDMMGLVFQLLALRSMVIRCAPVKLFDTVSASHFCCSSIICTTGMFFVFLKLYRADFLVVEPGSAGDLGGHAVVVLNIQNTTPQGGELPFKCRMLCVSLVVGTLAVALIFSLFHLGLISIGVAIWTSMGVFLAAAFYECFLLSLIVRHMLKKVGKNQTTAGDTHPPCQMPTEYR